MNSVINLPNLEKPAFVDEPKQEPTIQSIFQKVLSAFLAFNAFGMISYAFSNWLDPKVYFGGLNLLAGIALLVVAILLLV